MEKRLLIAIALSALVLIVYYVNLESPPHAGRQGSEVGLVEEETREEKELPVRERAPLPVAAEGEDIVVETSLYRLVLTTCGARIKSFRLKGYPEMWKEEKELERGIGEIERKLAKNAGEESLVRSKEILLYVNEERKKRTRRVEEIEEEIKEVRLRGDYERAMELEEELKVESGVELVPSAGPLYGDYPLTLSFPNLNLDLNTALFRCDVDRIALVADEKDTLRFEAEVAGVRVKKVFTFTRGEYVIGLDVVVENNSSDIIKDERAMLAYGPGVGLVEETQARGATKSIASYITGRPKAQFETMKRSFLSKPTMASGVSAIRTGDFEWVALRNKYFAAILIQKCEAVIAENLATGGYRVGVKMPPFSLENGESFRTTFKIYLGPQKTEELRRGGRALEKIIDYGFWGPIAKAIDYLLRKIFSVVGNYGWSIVVLSLFIKIVFYPLTHRTFEGMHKMQEGMKELQPKINALKEKYGDSQQKLNKATMELYRKEGINPLSGCKSGCFPMLLQMPVFFALYVVLYNSIDLRGTHFLGWITDLSSPDPWKVLPILMGVSMFWQQKQTGMGGASMGAGGAQQDQQKMMKWMMPVFLTFIFFRLPAGIVLYWLSFNIFTGLQQSLIMKKKNG